MHLTNLEQPFLTFTNIPLDDNYQGEVEELAALHRRTEAMDKAIREGREFDVLLDMLAEDGQDPIEYVESVEEQVNLIIAKNLVPDDWHYWRDRF